MAKAVQSRESQDEGEKKDRRLRRPAEVGEGRKRSGVVPQCPAEVTRGWGYQK